MVQAVRESLNMLVELNQPIRRNTPCRKKTPINRSNERSGGCGAIGVVGLPRWVLWRFSKVVSRTIPVM